MPTEERPIPFDRMIYFGDGMTDIPSMKLVNERGGNAIAVYAPKKSHERKKAIKLLADNRVNFALPADYSENKELDKVIKTILDKIATERDLDVLKNKEEKKKMEQKDELTNSGQRFPVEQVSNTGKPTKKQVKAAVKELNPDVNSLGSRG